MSKKTDIANAIKARLALVTGPALKVIEFKDIKMALEDFGDHEVPAIQFYDGGETIEHERARARKTWKVYLELINKSNETGTIDQTVMWDLQNNIETTLFAQPNLGVAGVLHMHYIKNDTDLHTFDPYYIIVFEIDVIYYDALVGPC
jgi:hypothetical protein